MPATQISRLPLARGPAQLDQLLDPGRPGSPPCPCPAAPSSGRITTSGWLLRQRAPGPLGGCSAPERPPSSCARPPVAQQNRRSPSSAPIRMPGPGGRRRPPRPGPPPASTSGKHPAPRPPRPPPSVGSRKLAARTTLPSSLRSRLGPHQGTEQLWAPVVRSPRSLRLRSRLTK